MRAIVNFWSLPGTSSSSTLSGFGAFGSGRIDFGSIGNSHSGSSMGAGAAACARLATTHINAQPILRIPFNAMPLMDTHVAILVPMPRITRRALPVDTVALARYLIGRHLVHVSARGRIAGRIVETEAYPPGDPTGYARPGLTTSNAPLFEARGTAYVRMVYGACLTLNLAAEPV